MLMVYRMMCGMNVGMNYDMNLYDELSGFPDNSY